MESINRPKLVQAHNLGLVRQKLFQMRSATRQQLSAATGISTVTLGTLLRELLDAGQILEGDCTQPAAGRPAHVYRFNARLRQGLLVSVENQNGCHRLNTAQIDLYGETLWQRSAPAVPMDTAATLRFFRQLLAEHPVDAIGIGLPGIGFGRYLRETGPGVEVSLEALGKLERETGIPIHVENDVNLMAVGCARRYRMLPEETLAYLYLMRDSYGGSAVWVGGKIHHGMDRLAGELPSPPYGQDWRTMAHQPREIQRRALEQTALPYLSILAPHRLVIASDYLDQTHLFSLSAACHAALWDWEPLLELEADPHADYHEGLKQTVLERLAQPILQP